VNPIPSPIPVTVVAAPAEWWQILGALSPLAVLVAAIVAATVGLLSLRQKARADNRSEWWRRAQWALDASLSRSRSEAEMGQKAIEILGHSELASREELALLKVGTEDELLAAAGASETHALAPSQRPAAVSSQDRKVQIAAAKARVTLDKRLGEDTPGWIVALSAEKPA
jgi:flagellar biogenesis protein FliO